MVTMPTRNNRFYSLVLVLTDVLVLLGAFTIAYILRVQYDPRPLLNQVFALDYVFSFMLIAPFWVLIFASLGLYSPQTYNRRLVEWGKLVVGVFVGMLLVVGWEYVSDQYIFPARLVVVYAFVAALLLLIIERELLRFIRSLLFAYGYGTSRVLLIGSTPATSDIARSLADTKRSGYEIVAIAGPKRVVPADLTDITHYSLVESALKHIDKHQISTIIQTDLYDSAERNQKILGAAQTRHIAYSFIPGESEFYAGKNTVDVFLGYPMITVSQTPLIGWGAMVKRTFDVVATILILVVLAPFFVALVLLQMILNPGPVFYVSRRLSRFSEPIKLIKFRSMGTQYGKRDAAEEFEAMGRPDLAAEYRRRRKVDNDPRITTFGRFLRATSLDELPQLINVLRGDLSLVGPRPILPQELRFDSHRAALLHSVKSGVTGLWQVSGRSNLSFEERIELELYYAQNWTFWLDIKILIKTVAVVFRGTGAK